MPALSDQPLQQCVFALRGRGAIGCIVAAGVALLGAIVAAVLLPAHPHDDITDWETEAIEFT